MREILFFAAGAMCGGLFGILLMCCLQISRYSEREDEYEKQKCADSFSFE